MSAKKYIVNTNDFIQPTKKEYVYLLGLLWADGYIDRGSIKLECKYSDSENLKTSFLKTGVWSIKYRNKFLKKTQKYYKQCKFSVSDVKFVKFLKSMDYNIKSSCEPIKILNLIPKDLHNHFFRGYVDGDGSFSLYKNTGSLQAKFNITSTINQNWIFIEHLFKEVDVEKHLINTYNRKSGKSSIISISNKYDITKFGEYLYFNSEHLRLERKYDKFLKIKNCDIVSNWNKNEVTFLKNNYNIIGALECSKILNKSIQSIYCKYYRIK